jgi:hypothetical protein
MSFTAGKVFAIPILASDLPHYYGTYVPSDVTLWRGRYKHIYDPSIFLAPVYFQPLTLSLRYARTYDANIYIRFIQSTASFGALSITLENSVTGPLKSVCSDSSFSQTVVGGPELCRLLFDFSSSPFRFNLVAKHTVTKKMKTYTQKINQQIKTMTDNENSKTIYTVQTGSFMKIEDAQKQYVYIVNGLNEKDLDFLRIEKVGKYYSLRFGKFKNYASAMKLLQDIKSRLSEAMILKAYIKNERIVRFYGDE